MGQGVRHRAGVQSEPEAVTTAHCQVCQGTKSSKVTLRHFATREEQGGSEPRSLTAHGRMGLQWCWGSGFLVSGHYSGR